MDQKNWQQIEALFNAAVELTTAERSSFLETQCGDDQELLEAVQSLLRHHTVTEPIDRMVREAAFEVVSTDPQLRGTRIGPWAVLEEIGKGGMGMVYLAERADKQYDQKVAIKLIANTFLNDEVLKRFLAERQILARLEHPNIARLLDGGTTDNGIPYLVMEYIEGKPVDVYCDQNQLTIRERLKLFQKICAAVQFAHQNLIVHRDLKPANILVGKDGEPRLLDFGIAKLLTDGNSETPADITRVGVRLFTPQYSSPEQIKGEPVNTMSDIYSLGVILYELLTGRRPYFRADKDSYSLEKAVIASDVVRPSSVLSQSTERYESLHPTDDKDDHLDWCGGLQTRQLKRLLTGDLDNILMMALRKDPQRRYLSANAFSADIGRYLRKEPITARPTTFAYRSGKFLSRHRLSSAMALGLTIAIVGFSITTRVQSRQIAVERDNAMLAQSKAEAISGFLVEMFSSIEPDSARGREVAVRDILDQTNERLAQADHALSATPEVEATIRRTIGSIYSRLGLLQAAQSALEMALSYHRHVKNPDQEELFYTLYELAGVANLNFDQTTRMKYLLEAQQISQQLWGVDHPNSLSIRAALASSYHMQGQLDLALELFSDVYQSRLRVLGKDHPDTITSISHMGIIHQWLGNFEESRKYYLLCFDEATRVLGERSTLRLRCMSNLGSLLETIGDFEGAERVLKEYIPLASIVLGENHPEVLRSMHNYADTLRGLARYDESEKLFLDTLNRRREYLGVTHIETLQTQFKLARLYRLMGRYEEAYPLASGAAKQISQQLGEDHPSAQSAIKELQMLEQAMKAQN